MKRKPLRPPKIVNEKHIQAAFLVSKGWSQKAIAAHIGYSETWISILINWPELKSIIRGLIRKEGERIFKRRLHPQLRHSPPSDSHRL